ncbi:hypothetical protein ACGFYV_17435 [Streptomyces sp. NPDC048297]|uniref:hypothetical protein n=1 Tax=Streptomyces sp. NPDC048297 TaxID=3365531 RepID=UPI0037233D10
MSNGKVNPEKSVLAGDSHASSNKFGPDFAQKAAGLREGTPAGGPALAIIRLTLPSSG